MIPLPNPLPGWMHHDIARAVLVGFWSHSFSCGTLCVLLMPNLCVDPIFAWQPCFGECLTVFEINEDKLGLICCTISANDDYRTKTLQRQKREAQVCLWEQTLREHPLTPLSTSSARLLYWCGSDQVRLQDTLGWSDSPNMRHCWSHRLLMTWVLL